MQPDFGAGLKRFLFESFIQTSYVEIEFAIRDQTSKYMPHIIINSISFNEGGIDRNRLGISINYSIPNIGVRDLLEFTI